MLEKSKKIILTIIMLFSFKVNVLAGIEILGGGETAGSDSQCGIINGYYACYYPKFQFRVTLVDSNGKKVENTRSVDFTYSNTTDTEIFSLNNLKSKGISLISSTEGQENQYQYKYGYNNGPNIGNFQYIQVKIDGFDPSKYQKNDQDDHSQYSNFFNEFINMVKNRDVKFHYDIATATTQRKTDFLSLFLKYSGYTESWQIEGDSDGITNIYNNDYYLLIEPTYTIGYSSTPNGPVTKKYGTSTEQARLIHGQITNNYTKYLNGYFVGLSSNFLYQIGCNLYTTPERSKDESAHMNFNPITKETNCSMNGLGYYSENFEDRSLRPAKMEEIIDPSKGYGAYVLNLKLTLDNGNPPSVETKVDTDLCKTENGVINLTINSENKKAFQNSYFKLSNTETDNGYCYDEVNYNFSNLINKLSSGKYRASTVIDNDILDGSPIGTLSVTRNCKLSSSINADVALANNIDSYKNNNVYLNVFGKKVKLIATEESRPNFQANTKWQTFTFKINYKLENPIVITANGYNSEAYISFDDYKSIFGSSNKIVSELLDKNIIQENKTINAINTSLTYRFNWNANSYATGFCPFSTKLDEKNPHDAIKFRTISLTNPFPGRDGKSRLPGTNWLDKKNYVYEYIINNRNVESDKVYNKKPIYTITLTTQDIVGIREYNKTHTYSDIQLKCTDGVMCESTFLTTISKRTGNSITKNETVTGGTCKNVSHTNPNDYELTKCYSDVATGYFCSKASYTDNNGKPYKDVQDILNSLNMKEIKYYSCADKTAASGGY